MLRKGHTYPSFFEIAILLKVIRIEAHNLLELILLVAVEVLSFRI